MSVDRLLAQHVRILENVAALERLADAPQPPAVEELSRDRWAFTRDLLLHFARIDSVLYARLQADPRPEVAERAVLAASETAELVADFRAHVLRWRGLPTQAQWQSYGEAVRGLMQRIRDRLDAETSLIARSLPLPCGKPVRSNRYAADAWEIRRSIYDNNQPVAEPASAGFGFDG